MNMSKTALVVGGAVALVVIGALAYEYIKTTANGATNLTASTGSYQVGTGASVVVTAPTNSGTSATEVLTSTNPNTVVSVNSGTLTGISGSTAPIGSNVGGSVTGTVMTGGYQGPNVSYAYKTNVGSIAYTGYGLTQAEYDQYVADGMIV